jgi:membrane protein implicated in regulation of membrane protease activity
MTIVYLATFIGGLLLAVRVMMFGVERPREENPSGERTFSRLPGVMIAFCIIFGAVGYILTARATGGPGSRVLISAALGLAAALISARLVTKWWAVTPEHDVDDERYVLQGHLARVIKAIAPSGEGEIAFDVGPVHRTMRASGLDGVPLETGTEVVIERIEGDLAFVEAWAEVEKRL